MKKVIVFRVEDVLVKDFNKEDSLRRAVSIETNKLKKSVGLDVLEREIKKKGKDEEDCEELKVESMEKWKEIEGKVRMKEKEKKEWVERREREFYDREFERSKFKSGIGEIMKLLKGMKERMGVNVVFVTDHRKSKVGGILWNNGLRDVEVENCNGNWIERVLDDCGKNKEDVILFSNKSGDLESSEEWGIKVENFRVEMEGMNGFMGKIGLKMCA